MRLTRPLLLILCCSLFLTSCGIIDIAYNNATTLVASEIEDAFDLDDNQSQQLDQRLQGFFSWHRQQELRRYQLMLEQAALDVEDGITAAEFLKLNDDIRRARFRAVDYAIDQFGDLANSLTPAQIDNFREYSRERAEDDQDYLDKSAQQREIYQTKRGLKRLQKWFGDFSDIKEDRIKQRLQALPDLYEHWYRYRDARQQALFELLENPPAGGITPASLKSVLLDPSTSYALAFETPRREYWQAYAVMLEEISGWLNQSQKQKVVSRLEDYARIAGRLHNQGEVTTAGL